MYSISCEISIGGLQVTQILIFSGHFHVKWAKKQVYDDMTFHLFHSVSVLKMLVAFYINLPATKI
jgi:Na+/H+ antiporter NhaC